MHYETAAPALEALLRDVPYPIANLANAAAFIFQEMPRLNWAGFYLAEQNPQGEKLLVLGPFQGKPACIEIPWGKGVCGTAAALDQALRVEDVHDFPGHIACDAASASEVVVPLHDRAGAVAGVLDLDSPEIARFTEADLQGLIRLANLIEAAVFS